MLRPLVRTALCMLFVCFAASSAYAQYRNLQFGLDFGYMVSTKPTPTLNNYPLRLSSGYRLGFDANFRVGVDNLWVTSRFNTAFLQYGGNDSFAKSARAAMGTILGLEGAFGAKWVFLTDRIRPYLGASVSYMRLISFSNPASTCTAPLGFNGAYSGASCAGAYLPHANIFAVHVEPGIEFIVAPNMAIKAFADLQRWLIINATDNHAAVFGLGFVLFT